MSPVIFLPYTRMRPISVQSLEEPGARREQYSWLDLSTMKYLPQFLHRFILISEWTIWNTSSSRRLEKPESV